jgi:hypothetical protein
VLEHQRGTALGLQRRVDRSLEATRFGGAVHLGLDDTPQEDARVACVGTEALERAVELEQVDRDLLHFLLLGLIGAVGRGDEKPEHQCRHSRDEAHHELHDVLRIAFPVVLRQAPVQVEPDQAAAERAGECDHRDGDRAHGVHRLVVQPSNVGLPFSSMNAVLPLFQNTTLSSGVA